MKPVGSASLYLHVPFCSRRCGYCDFYSVPVDDAGADAMDAFVEALLGDAGDQLAFFGVDDVPTVYVGGGTPSALGAARTGRLLAGLERLLPPPRGGPREFTVEANPESADAGFLRACADGGVTRISLGAQTFDDRARLRIGRAGDSALLSRSLALAAERFPGAFSADLIAGLPFQDRRSLLRDVGRLLEFGPAHVSLYALSLAPETPLGASALAGREPFLPTPDEADGLWLAGRDALEGAGLGQYEVSNFALPGKACAHNRRYWRMESWLGAGPSASGTAARADGTGERVSFPADLAAYLGTPRPRFRSALVESLSPGDLARESLLMGFRLRDGPDSGLFESRFGLGVDGLVPESVARWREKGFFEPTPEGALAPSRDGLRFLDGFLRDAFAELDRGGRL